MLRVVKDSVNAGGDRLTTVLTDRPDLAAGPGARAVTGTAGRYLVTTAACPPVIDQPDGVVTAPRLVDNTWIHAPFLTPDEWVRFDASFCGTVSAARCARTGRPISGGYTAEMACYLRTLTGDDVSALHHVALPITQQVFDGLDIVDGRFAGWITWAEMLRWRGGPW